jgi:hypothetical protein
VNRGTTVILSGNVKGEGREAECMVEARRIGVDSGNELPRTYCYTDCSVVVAPADLPDGDYTVYFDGHSFLATRLRGTWLSTGPCRELFGT